MSFYILVGLCVGFYIAMTSVYTKVAEAKREGVNNLYTNNITLVIGLNILFLAVIWPILIPYFFSANFREAIESGFTLAIFAED